MATRTDVEVIWHLSPRVILFESAPVTAQDIVDTIRVQEDTFQGMGQPFLLSASGKQDLGGGVIVGITNQLQDAQVATRPIYTILRTGTVTTGTSPIPTGLRLIDTAGLFVTNGVKRGDLLVRTEAGPVQLAQVLDVVSEIELFSTLLNNGSTPWAFGESYAIFQNSLAQYRAGNLTAVDDALSAIDPVFSTFGYLAQVELSTSAALVEGSGISAGEIDSIVTGVWAKGLTTFTTEGTAGDVARRQAFDGAVYYDSAGTAGTAFPIGTPGKPVSNLTDAKTIADSLGLRRIFISSLAFFPALDFIKYEFQGLPDRQIVAILAGQTYQESSFRGMVVTTITNESFGSPAFVDCLMSSMNLDAGVFVDCEMDSTITSKAIGFAPPAVFAFTRCKSRDLTSAILDCNAIETRVNARQCSGIWRIRNCSAANSAIQIGLTDGEVVIESSCTAGTVTITGTCKVTDDSTGTTVIDSTAQSNVWSMSTALAGAVVGSIGEHILKKMPTVAKLIAYLKGVK